MTIPTTRSVESVLPLVIIGVALWALLFREVPPGNKELATAVVSGLLGYLAKSREPHAPEAKP